MEDVLAKTEGLMETLRQTEIYRRYERDLKALREHPDVYQELNRFRRENLRLTMSAASEEYYEKTEALQTQYKNILMDSVVLDFLASEQGVCKMMRKVYDRIAQELQLDLSYMDEE